MISPNIAVFALLALQAGSALGHEAADMVLQPRVLSSTESTVANNQAPGHSERLAIAEALLAQGLTTEARDAFEQAAAREHTADIELGILRCQMQAGQYQQALDFAAHTAAAHPEVGSGAAFYAWLLHIGGMTDLARQQLDRASRRLPGNLALARVRELLSNPGKDKETETTAAQDRLSPYAIGSDVPERARMVGTAVLLKGGRIAIAPLEALNQQAAIWVRNGLGRTVHAHVERRDASSGLSVLALDEPLDDPDLVLAARDGFPGSAAYTFGYLTGPARNAAWPMTSVGFLGMPKPDEPEHPLGMAVPAGTGGAPVIDPSGRLLGVVLPSKQGEVPHFSGIETLRRFVGKDAAVDDERPKARRSLESLYEQSLRMALQLIVANPQNEP